MVFSILYTFYMEGCLLFVMNVEAVLYSFIGWDACHVLGSGLKLSTVCFMIVVVVESRI